MMAVVRYLRLDAWAQVVALRFPSVTFVGGFLSAVWSALSIAVGVALLAAGAPPVEQVVRIALSAAGLVFSFVLCREAEAVLRGTGR